MVYYVVYAFWYLLSLLPMRIHYLLSDGLYLIIYRLAKYRIKVVRNNLSSSFPEKTEDELRQIERDFYHWFCDYIAETVKMFSMSEDEMRRRMHFEGAEQINEDIRQGKCVTIFLGHYCNWEWVSSLPLNISSESMCVQLYHPIENKSFDRLFLHSRGRFHSHSVEMKEAFKLLVGWQKEGKITVTGFISDQVPGYASMHYWPQFLHHDTPAYTGGERIARIMGTTVYYLDIERPRRGYYIGTFVKVCDNPKSLPKFAITEQYYRMLENSIQRAPAYWLWSHNRWKRTREQFNELYSEEERKRILNKL